jgi:hypothetical protein
LIGGRGIDTRGGCTVGEIEPGLHDDVPEAEYHGHAGSLSVSGAKVLLRSPAHFAHQREHPPPPKAIYDYGHAAHKLVLGVGDPIAVVDAADWRSGAAKAARADARSEGAVPMLRKDYAKVESMADRLSSHAVAMQLLSEGRPEVSAYALDEPTGVLRRGRVDWLHPALLVDYKTAVSAHPDDLSGRYGVMRKNGYDQQAAWYTDLLRDLGHPAEAFAFIVQEKEPPYEVAVVYIDEDDLADARARNRLALEMYRDCTASGIWPGAVPDTSIARLSLTERAHTLEDMS